MFYNMINTYVLTFFIIIYFYLKKKTFKEIEFHHCS